MPSSRVVVFASAISLALAACVDNSRPDTGDGGQRGDAGAQDGGTDAGVDAGPPAGAPGAPTLSAATSPFPGSIALSWTPSGPAATSYGIQRASDSAGFQTIAHSSAPAYTDTTVQPGPAYSYRVTGSNDLGEGAPSNAIPVLGAPFDVSAGGSDTRVIVRWTGNEAADSYDVYRVPAAGTSGAPALVATTSDSAWLDDGGVIALHTGDAVAYQVVAKAGGALSSIASNLAQGSVLGLDVVANEIFVSDTGEESDDLAPVLFLEARNLDGGPLLDDAGAPVLYESVTDGQSIVVPGVPRGSYAITVAGYHDYAVSSARRLDFSQAAAGRANLQRASFGTELDYALSGLAPWSSPPDGGLADRLEAISLGAGNFAGDLAQDVSTPPAAGATSFTGAETLGLDGDDHLLDADAGDALYLFQLHAQTSAGGVPYLAPAGSLPQHAFTTQQGGATPISGALQATTPIAIGSLDFPRSAWLDLTRATLPAGAANPGQRVFLELEKAYSAHGWYSNDSLADGLVLSVPQAGGTAQADGGVTLSTGALSWADPVAASWEAFTLVQAGWQVPLTLSFQDTSQTPPVAASGTYLFASYSSQLVPMSGTTFSDSSLAPQLSPPRAPLLDGASLLTAQAGQSPTATLSWSPPAISVPLYYLVVIYSLRPQTNDDGSFVKDGAGDYLLETAEAASFTTAATQIPLAADLVRAGQSYFATIDAVTNAGAAGSIDATLSPYLLGPEYVSMQTVTAPFTIRPAGARPPAERSLTPQSLPLTISNLYGNDSRRPLHPRRRSRGR